MEDIYLNLEDFTKEDVAKIWNKNEIDELPTSVQQYVFDSILKRNS